jgi:dihydroorotase-like cyclic amidohydrolase
VTTYLVKNVSVLGAEPTDLLLADGVVKDMGPGLSAAALPSAEQVETVDASGLIALPGLVDLHTHLREPGREDAETVESGTRAAALGGFTAVHAMANTEPATPPVSSSRSGGWAARPAAATSTRSVRSPSDWRGSGWQSSARWPTRRPACGSSPTTASA